MPVCVFAQTGGLCNSASGLLADQRGDVGERPVRDCGAVEGEGGSRLSFTMLALNADHHPLMKRFHKPGSEKRSVIIIWPDDYDDWLGSHSIDEARSFVTLPDVTTMVARPLPKA